MIPYRPKNGSKRGRVIEPLGREIGQLLGGGRPDRHPTKMIRGIQTALQVASGIAGLLPGVSEVKTMVEAGQGAYELAKNVKGLFSTASSTPAIAGPPDRPVRSASVAAGTVSVPSRQVSYASGTVGNAIAARSGMGTPVAFRNINHPVHGPALRLTGTQIFSMVTQGTSGTAALASVTSKALQPRSMSYIVGLISDVFQTYRFNWIKLRYVPGCPTTTPGQVRFAYLADPNGSAFETLDFATTAQSPFQMTCAAWEPASLIISPVPCTYDKLYQYDIGTTGSIAAARTTMQGRVYGFWSGPQSQASEYTTGTLEIDYEVDLFDAGPSIGGLPTLVHPMQEMRLAFLRGEEKDGDTLRLAVHRLVDDLAQASALRGASLKDGDGVVPLVDPGPCAVAASASSSARGAPRH